MAEAYYEPTPATDGATMNPVPGAVFQVFEIADTSFTTPLSLRVGSGNPTTSVTASDTLATLPGVYVTSPNFEHIWKSGTFEWRRDSIDGAKKAIEDAKIAASNSASASDASAVSAATSAQAAQDAAALVDAPADQIMADTAANPATAFATALSATIAGEVDPVKYSNAATAGSTRGLLGKLKRGITDAAYLYIGDSTGNSTNEHVYLEAVELGQRFPAYTVTIRFWDETGGLDYLAPQTIQAGTSTRTLTIWNCSASGQAPNYVLGSRWAKAVAQTKPDLVFISHAHNMSDPGTTEGHWHQLRNQYLMLTEEVAATFPAAGIVLMSQNPSTVTGRTTWQARKADVLQEVAGLRGYGFIDVHQAFMDSGAVASLLEADGVHPNTVGSQLWADIVGAALTTDRDAAVLPQGTPPLVTPGKNLLPNGGFTAWGGVNPDGWAATNATATKDTAEFENGTYSMRLAPVAAGAAYMQADVNPATAGIKGDVSGRVLTLAARVKAGTDHAATTRIQLYDNTGSGTAANCDLSLNSLGRFTWLFATKRMADPATMLYVRLQARTTGSAVVNVVFDRAYVVPGVLPNVG